MGSLPAFFLHGAKIASRDKSSTTFNLKGGHTLRVQHSLLKPEHRKALMKLPVQKLAGGGEPTIPKEWLVNQAPPAQPSDSPILDTLIPPQQEPAMANGQPLFGSGDKDNPNPQLAAPPQAPAPEAVPSAPAPAAAVPGVGAEGVQAINPMNAINQLHSANNQMAVLRGQEAQQNAKTQENQIAAEKAYQEAVTINYKDFKDQQDKVLADLGKSINPNHYIESMQTPQKVATAIGLFLGGWGSAYTHQGNPALEFLNKQIDRDIQSQRDNLDNKKSLLSANQALYHDKTLADQATRASMNSIYNLKIQKAANDIGTPMAKLRAQQLNAQTDIQNTQLVNSMAQRATVLHFLASGDLQKMDPSQQIRLQEMAGLMQPEEAKAATDALGKIQGIESLRKDVEDNAHDLGNKFMAGKLEPGYRDAKINNLAGILGKVAEGRFNLEESKMQMNAMMPGAFNRSETREAQAAGRNQFFDSLRTEHEAALNKFNIHVPHLPLKDPNEGRTGTLPNGQRVMIKNGQPVPIR